MHIALANCYSDYDTKARWLVQQLFLVYNDKTDVRQAQGEGVVDMKLAQQAALYILQTTPCPWPQAKYYSVWQKWPGKWQ